MSLCSLFTLAFGKVSVLHFRLVMFLRLGGMWSFSAEASPVRAFLAAGAPLPASGVRLRRGSAQFGHVAVGGPVVGKLRSDLGSGDGQSVHLFKDASVSLVVLLRRRLGCVLSVLDGISWHGLTISRSLELGVQWDAVVAAGRCGPLGNR